MELEVQVSRQSFTQRALSSLIRGYSNTLSLLLPLLPLMPEEMFSQIPPLELAFSIDDGPRGMVHNTFRERSEVLARSGRCTYRVSVSEIMTNLFF